uniref:PAS:GGDEF:Hemerythrin HHE cation binding region n=1 Tax=Dechloromonas aromatica (strain RCB) TaxID=159087 RepID=Q478P9_DECAR
MMSDMNSLLDIRTLILVITIVVTCRTFILGYVWKITRPYRPASYWAIGSLLISVGELLVGLRDHISPVVSILLAQCLIMTGWMSITGGISIAARHKPAWRTGGAFIALAILCTFWFLVISPDFAIRTYAASLPVIGFDLYAAFVCLRFKEGAQRATFRILAITLLAQVISNLVKTAYIGINELTQLFDARWQVGQFYVVSVITASVSTALFVLLAVQRLQEQLNAELLARREIDHSVQLAAMVYQASSEGMLVTEPDGRIISVNPAFTAISGYTQDELVGKTPRIFKSGKQEPEFYAAMWREIIATGHWKGELWNRHKDGNLSAEALSINTIRNPDGSPQRFVALYHDVTSQKQSAEVIYHQANHDQLTNLANRNHFFQQLSKELSRARRTGKRVGLLFTDLNRFKPINDQFGHEAGDTVLKTVSQRWLACVRDNDLLARIGGDEFALIICDLNDVSQTKIIARKLIATLEAPIAIGNDQSCTVGTSIGIAIYPDNAMEMDSLISVADAAMYASKSSGNNIIRLADVVASEKKNQSDWIVFESGHLVGVKKIDEQHQELVRMVNKINRAIHSRCEDASLKLMFNELVAFTEHHFSTELRFMIDFHYPETDVHDQQHQALVAQLSNLITRFEQGDELQSLQMIKDWLLRHIEHADKPLGAYLASKGAN